MTDTIYLICGVSGSGKSWVCKQLTHKFAYLPHDEHYKDFGQAIAKLARASNKPVITECPFGERPIKDDLERRGLKVIPIFVIEAPDIVRKRFIEREKRQPQQAALTRATTILRRAKDWNAPHGTSNQILQYLRAL